MNSDLIQDWLGKHVRVYSGQGYTDDGILEAADDHWLRLNVQGDLLIFPLYGVRLIKLMESVTTREEAGSGIRRF